MYTFTLTTQQRIEMQGTSPPTRMYSNVYAYNTLKTGYGQKAGVRKCGMRE